MANSRKLLKLMEEENRLNSSKMRKVPRPEVNLDLFKKIAQLDEIIEDVP